MALHGNDATPRTAPPHFIVIVPGYMGSKLRSRTTGELVWVDFGSIPKNPLQWDDWLNGLFGAMAYPNDDLEPAGIMEEVVIVPPWAKQEHYGRLFDALERIGYRADPRLHPENELDVYAFDYDWRQDNRISARELGEAIARWQQHHPGAKAWLIAHSNGGLVSRWHIEKEGGKDHVGRLFLMGSPWDGSPKSMRILFGGLDMLFRRGFNLFDVPGRTRNLLRTFPSAYQLIPCYNPFLRDANNNPIDPFADTGWIDNDAQRAMLDDGKRFTEDLAIDPSVETLCFFGRKRPTVTYGIVETEAMGRWKAIEWFATEAGDGTVPERSAVHPHADQKLPFVAGHGDIYVNPAVLEFLQWELVDKFVEGARAAVVTPEASVLFEPDQDVYAPGQTIQLWAQVLGAEGTEGQRPPITEAAVVATLTYREPLPGDELPATLGAPVRATLEATAEPGRYEASLLAPAQEGYYSLTAVVDIPDEPPISLSELIVVEKQAP